MDELARIRFETELEAAIRADDANGNHLLETALRARGPQHHTDVVQPALTLTIAADLPHKCPQKVKRHLRRECRKPLDMKVREFANHMNRINSEEIPKIPPAAANQSMSQDEPIEILLYGTPKSWQREMDRQCVYLQGQAGCGFNTV